MTHKEVETYLLSFPNTKLTYPFGEDVAVYKVLVQGEEKMFALLPENKSPLQISLKCDPQLAVILRETYVSVMPGYHLNKKHWNTIILGQEIAWEEIQGFIVHSYNLVAGK
jgi:predicted DNA-binding protein (MmcQ/YjbR family)